MAALVSTLALAISLLSLWVALGLILPRLAALREGVPLQALLPDLLLSSLCVLFAMASIIIALDSYP